MEDNDKLEIPEVIVHFKTGDMYKRGPFLGKGYFAQCYMITDIKNNAVYAAKIIPKSHINYSKSILNEVSLHGRLKHKHIVKLHTFFEDYQFGYILMDVCHRGNMQDILKPRVVLTEPEVRYYLKQILAGLAYLHGQLIIHRDLKLGNILLTNDLQVKIGDLGTAIQSSKGMIHHGICGTPNYIAPEVVTDAGHSFEFDIFSTGCILYTLLLGIPPFQDISKERVFERVQFCKYFLPDDKPSMVAKDLIQRMLQLNPKDRPTVQQSLLSQFMKGFVPASIPLSSLTEAPQFEECLQGVKSDYHLRKPLREMNRNVPLTSVFHKLSEKDRPCTPKVPLPSCRNITSKVLAVAEKSQESAKPQDGGNVEPRNNSPNPFDISEQSQPIVCPQCGNEPNIFSGHCSCKSVEHKISQHKECLEEKVANLLSGTNEESYDKIFSSLKTVNIQHKTKLMNRLCGIPCSGVKEDISKSSGHPSNMFARRQTLVLDETQRQKNCTISLKRISINTKTTEQDTHMYNEVSIHKSQGVEEIEDNSQAQNVIIVTKDVNMQSGLKGMGTTIAELRNITDESINDHEKKSLTNVRSSALSTTDTQVYSERQITKFVLSLHELLKLITNSGPGEKCQQFQADKVDNDMLSTKVVRVLRWQEFTSQDGFAYQLSNGSTGALFDDGTHLLSLSDGTYFRFANCEGEVSWSTGEHSANDDKKARILVEFNKSLEKSQETAVNLVPLAENSKGSPYIVKRYRDSATVMMLLTNGTCQIDILTEDTQIFFYPQLTTLVFGNATGQLQTLPLKSLLESGCCQEMSRSFRYAFDAVNKIITGWPTHNDFSRTSTTEKRKKHAKMSSIKKPKTIL